MTQSRWNPEPESDTEAIEFLEKAGYRCLKGFTWTKPTRDHVVSKDENIAIWYLFLEWDWGGLEEPWVDPTGVPTISGGGQDG